MNIASILSLTAYVLLSAVTAAGIWTGKNTNRYLKPLLMPSLLAFYVITAEEPEALILLALIYGFLGDIFLMRTSLGVLAAGLFSFLAGHVCYAVYFYDQIRWTGFHPVMLILALYLMYLFWMLHRLKPGLQKDTGKKIGYKMPVVLYMTVIMFMSYFAVLMTVMNGNLMGVLCIAGSLLFIVSDSILACRYFLRTSGKWVMPTYLAAQLLIILGILL